MRTRARYVLLVVCAVGVTALLYLHLSSKDGHHGVDQEFDKWNRQRHQLLIQPFDDRHPKDTLFNPDKLPQPINFAPFPGAGNKEERGRREHTWRGTGEEVKTFEEAYSNAQHLQEKRKQLLKIDRSTCKPLHNITFLKVHKTGSSTLQNIFLRFGQRHKLNFVLPPYGHHLGFPEFFSHLHMLPVDSGLYNIFCHHSRFSKVIPEIMPPNSVYISILRDPVHVFESAFTYFKIDYRLKMTDDKDAMSKFLENPSIFYINAPSVVHMRNNMLYDFGVPSTKYDDMGYITGAIDKIDQQFSLILIAEYFEESLILLRDVLCWRTEDMVVFKMNSRNQTSVDSLKTGVQEKIRSWNAGDVMLYDHFNKTLWRKIEEYGRDKMAKEVKELQALTDHYHRLCIQTDSADRKEGEFDLWQPPGVKINNFVLKESARDNPVCENMVRPEIVYTHELRRAQFPKIPFRKTKRSTRRRKAL
ncbi:galactosylceramide sulfotransferase-like [Asterias amurensis]|uniref:galactosylceramide sulfotransferase-like n=1 Tax=Asterias amurensis TaxID=7602 RepID=UPI003AB43C95